MSDFDYLRVQEGDISVLKNITTMGEHLKKLKVRVLAAEAELKAAKKEHDYYASSILPMEMFNAGLSEIRLISGEMMRYERKFYCQPNKNAADRKIIYDWLKDNDGEFLIKEKATVDGAQIDKLKESGIPYIEYGDVNTNSLKSFLKDKIGAGGGTVQLEIADIPECIHFQEVGVVDIEI